jgi:hypothetical protein
MTNVVNRPVSKQESVRLHEDWWGKCRTCRFWNGADKVREREGREPLVSLRWEDSPCENPMSPWFGQVTSTEGECSKWDSFDVDTALAVIEPSHGSS